MMYISRGLLAASVGLLIAGTSCSQIQSAGSLGYMMHGSTLLRPTPDNFRHVPPRDQDRTPTPMQWGLDF
ncbi:hypothetical protein EI77_01425 [Prosthecobacter fusiformis]|uniref:Uncharacterized protein n=1 Tax=Prosthecobacter fusiformis TaxID=48464 RepID=A0A4R7S511_9BACT|nr:hypothetical protein [Prosthecobacter fusiformis]TDU72959.1 hypothetical protein EI77_01425 [Prosthecobacter fusiformis]